MPTVFITAPTCFPGELKQISHRFRDGKFAPSIRTAAPRSFRVGQNAISTRNPIQSTGNERLPPPLRPRKWKVGFVLIFKNPFHSLREEREVCVCEREYFVGKAIFRALISISLVLSSSGWSTLGDKHQSILIKFIDDKRGRWCVYTFFLLFFFMSKLLGCFCPFYLNTHHFVPFCIFLEWKKILVFWKSVKCWKNEY